MEGSISKTVGKVAAEDVEANLVLFAHVPTGGSSVKINLVVFQSDRIGVDCLARDLFAALGAVYNAVIMTARFVGGL